MPQEAGARFALQSARERAASLAREVRRLQSKDFAFDLPRTILQVIEKAVGRASQELADLEHDQVLWHAATPMPERLDTIRTRALAIQWLHDSLTILDKVDSARIPFEAVRAFEDLAGELLPSKPSVSLLLHPQRDFNYGLLDLANLFEPVVAEWSQHFPGPGCAFALFFPSADSSAVLMHTLFLHEIGHALYESIFPEIKDALKSAVALADRELDGDISREIDSSLKGLGFPEPTAPGKQRELWDEIALSFRSTLLDEATEIISNWVEEITCDACATRLAGPAYLCAFEAFFLPFFSCAESSESHPAPGLRLEVIGRCLARDRAAFASGSRVFDRYGDHAGPVQGLQRQPSGQQDLKYRIAQHVLRAEPGNAFLERLLDAVFARAPSPLTNTAFEDAVTGGLAQMENLVPPNPFLHASDATRFSGPEIAAYVFSACWIFKLSNFGKWREHFDWSSEACEDVLNQLGLKALEAADLERRYRARQGHGAA